MHHSGIATAFEAVVVASTVVGLAGAAWSAARRAPAASAHAPRARRLLFHPLAQLLFVCALILTNQVLCDAYILRAHGGDPGFVVRYLGPGWFSLATGSPLVRFVAAHVGDARWLAPTVLRVQAFLELPFTIFAYLTVARMLGRGVQRRLVRPALLVPACVSFSITFSLVEVMLWNPWTTDDLVLRAVAAVVTPAWVALAWRLEGGASADANVDVAREGRPSGVLGLFAFLAGAGAIAYVVLALYDALLLYNLAHLSRYAGGLVLAIPIAALASLAAPRIDALVARGLSRGRIAGPSPAIDAVVSSLATFTVVFFVPSLSLRYWGGHESAVLAGALLVCGSAIAGLAAAARRARDAWTTLRIVVGASVAAVVAAICAASVAAQGGTLPELVLARTSLTFLAIGVVAFRTIEILLGGGSVVCSSPHEAKAQADEA